MQLKDILRNRFILNIATLASGTAVSQALLFFATPFLTRLYTPREFGIFTLYIGIVGVIGIVSTWQYEVAVLMPKDQKDSKFLLSLSLFISFFMSIIVFILILIFKKLIISYVSEFEKFLWIVPFGVMFSGIFQAFNSFNVRNKSFKNITLSKITRVSNTIGYQIVSKTLGGNFLGLIIGNLFGVIIGLIVLIYNAIFKFNYSIFKYDKKRILELAKEYDKFPKYHSWVVLFSSLSEQLPSILLPVIYSPEIAGFFGLTYRMLIAPISLIANSTRNVYMQKASQMFAQEISIKSLYLKTTVGLIKVGIVPFLILGIFAPFIFQLFFGLEWRISGVYAQLTIFYFFILFIKPPTDASFVVLGLQKSKLIYQIIYIIVLVSFMLIIPKVNNNPIYGIIGYGALGAIFGILLIVFLVKKVNRKYE